MLLFGVLEMPVSYDILRSICLSTRSKFCCVLLLAGCCWSVVLLLFSLSTGQQVKQVCACVLFEHMRTSVVVCKFFYLLSPCCLLSAGSTSYLHMYILAKNVSARMPQRLGRIHLYSAAASTPVFFRRASAGERKVRTIAGCWSRRVGALHVGSNMKRFIRNGLL